MEKRKLTINIGQALVKIGSLSEYQLKNAMAKSKQTGRRIKDILVDLGYINEPDLANLFSKRLHLPELSLQGLMIKPDLKTLVPVEMARRCSTIPIFSSDNVLAVVTDDPLDFKSLTEIAEFTGKDIYTAFTTKTEINKALEKYDQIYSVFF